MKKKEMYDQFITQVQDGKLPSIDSAIFMMKLAEDHVEEDESLPQIKNNKKNVKLPDKTSIKLRSIPKYLINKELKIDCINLNNEEFMMFLELTLNNNSISFTFNQETVNESNYKVLNTLSNFSYDIVNKDTEKPFAYIDAFTECGDEYINGFPRYQDQSKLKYLIRVFDLAQAEDLYFKMFNLNFEVI